MANIKVPTIYFWEDLYNDKPILITAAFKWRNMFFGESYPIDDSKFSKIRKKGDRSKLIERIKEALDIVIHHGTEALDSHGNIHQGKVNDLEARRYWLDPNWRSEVIALRKVMIVKDITREQAVKMELL